MTIRYVAIAGTHGSRLRLDWDRPHSPFADFLRRYDCVPLVEEEYCRYAWDTELDGVLNDQHYVWDAGGRSLFHYLVPPLHGSRPAIPPDETFLITHSHAGNLVAYACGKYGLKVNGLITVGMPIRYDLRDLYARAAKNIRVHLHLHAGWQDAWQVLGNWGDGGFGVVRKHPYAKNDRMPRGHENILRDHDLFSLWVDRGWLDYWRKDAPAVAA